MSRYVRSLAAVAVLAIAITVGGCWAFPSSRLPEYQASAEELAHELRDAIPADLLRESTVGFTSNGVAMPNVVSADRSRDSAHWSLHWWLPVVDLPASRAAVDAMAAELESRGWTGTYLRTTDGGVRITDAWRGEYAGERWHVQLSYVQNDPAPFHNAELAIVSPTTIRGDEIIH